MAATKPKPVDPSPDVVVTPSEPTPVTTTVHGAPTVVD